MPKSSGGTAGGSRSKISYVRPNEPSFLKKLKEQVGYKGPSSSVESKFDELDREELTDGEDEQPTIVVLRDGDLTAEEAKSIKEDLERKEEEKMPADGKIVFRKPTKRASDSIDGKEDSKKKTKKEAKKSQSLLSFDEDEEEYD